jgi:hypothetical protein
MIALILYNITLSLMKVRVFNIIYLKVITNNKIYTECQARIGDMSLAEWLKPSLKD